MLKHILATVVVLTLAAGADAGSREDGVSAYRSGDYEIARELWTPLAQNGDADAQNNLGVMYYKGEGVPRDGIEAAKWFQFAAEQGHAKAQSNLGAMYVQGWGVEPPFDGAMNLYKYFTERTNNMPLAHMWFSLAAAQGNTKAALFHDWVAATMTPDQIAEAHRMAREWLAAH